MDFQTLSVLASALFAVSAGAVGGIFYAVRKSGVDDLRDRLTRVEADVSWIRSALEKLEARE